MHSSRDPFLIFSHLPKILGKYLHLVMSVYLFHWTACSISVLDKIVRRWTSILRFRPRLSSLSSTRLYIAYLGQHQWNNYSMKSFFAYHQSTNRILSRKEVFQWNHYWSLASWDQQSPWLIPISFCLFEFLHWHLKKISPVFVLDHL